MARTPKVVEDRREQILDAALRVFSEKGFATATNKDIAQEADITPGLIYHYFASKEALLLEIIRKLSASRVIRSLPEQVIALPVQDLFKALALRLLDIVEEENYTRLIHIYMAEMLFHSDVVPEGLVDIQETVVFLEKILNAKIESGEIPPTDTHMVIQIFLSAIMGFVLRRQVLRDPLVLQYSHEQIAASLATSLMKSLNCW